MRVLHVSSLSRKRFVRQSGVRCPVPALPPARSARPVAAVVQRGGRPPAPGMVDHCEAYGPPNDPPSRTARRFLLLSSEKGRRSCVSICPCALLCFRAGGVPCRDGCHAVRAHSQRPSAEKGTAFRFPWVVPRLTDPGRRP